jgi:hypothetical protein
MKSKRKQKNDLKLKIYTKPEIKQETSMNFMFDTIKKSKYRVSCRQCSSCHGCR